MYIYTGRGRLLVQVAGSRFAGACHVGLVPLGARPAHPRRVFGAWRRENAACSRCQPQGRPRSHGRQSCRGWRGLGHAGLTTGLAACHFSQLAAKSSYAGPVCDFVCGVSSTGGLLVDAFWNEIAHPLPRKPDRGRRGIGQRGLSACPRGALNWTDKPCPVERAPPNWTDKPPAPAESE